MMPTAYAEEHRSSAMTAGSASTVMKRRSNAEWLAALEAGGSDQTEALADLRTYLLRAALFTLQRSRHYVGRLGPSALGTLAEDCAQESMTAVLQHLADFRGESHFTTWAYTFAVNIALVAARRERWGDPGPPPDRSRTSPGRPPSPSRRVLHYTA